LGKAIARGTLSLIAPTETITATDTRRVIDGVEMVFRLAPDSEAPSEMLIWFPGFRVLDMAEDATHTMHNLYPLRGSEVRDARLWSRYISDALESFGPGTDILVGQHHWPTTGHDRVIAFMKQQRDMYKFINDQSIRLMNRGLRAGDIAESLHLPASLEREW